ncbi:hypothetical protein [Levilactobacillus yiduensis]|uniref:hypothetical protein n=1 Tax=Levilactobacillus yiduensis TaxID=2953880 RepID=UPI000EF2C1EC|nr:hypothetical protein [Levilactobacillus yiduensis]AYM03690.1 hypothetical protein D8911_12110 [Levilactobacillus brevis]
MKTEFQNTKYLAHAMKRIAEKYGFELFSVDLIAAFNESPYRQCRPKTIIFFTPNTDQQLIAFLSFWQGHWHPLINPRKYKVYFNVTQPKFTRAMAVKFADELNRLTDTDVSPLRPHDFISDEDWLAMATE